jgi:hypothetical protein
MECRSCHRRIHIQFARYIVIDCCLTVVMRKSSTDVINVYSTDCGLIPLPSGAFNVYQFPVCLHEKLILSCVCDVFEIRGYVQLFSAKAQRTSSIHELVACSLFCDSETVLKSA